jgi:prepilin-type N-terminal cleavage/methylation domain-containing protein
MANLPRKGFALIEVLISILLLGLISVAFFAAMGTATKSLMINDEQQTSKNLAEMELEYIKGLPYDDSYLPADVPAGYAGYSVMTEADGRLYAQAVDSRDHNIQKLVLMVLHNGRGVYEVSDYKVR